MESDISREQALCDIRDILAAQRFGVLSTHAAGQPYASLVAFSATEDLQQVLFCTPRATHKYANLSRDPRAAMLFHTSRNAADDCTEAMSVTATGTTIEVPEGRREADATLFLTRHPGLADFVADPQSALLALEVSEYHLVRRFQDVVRLPMAQVAGAPPAGTRDEGSRPGVAVILLAHGSRDEAWRAGFEQLADSLAGSLGEGRVRAAYLQLAPPTLLDAVTATAEEGFRRIAVLPLFIAAGGHVMRDVPAQVSAVQEQWSDLQITVLPRIGETPGFVELVGRLVRKAAGSMASWPG